MSRIVGPDGKTPIQSDLPLKEFKAGGLKFETKITPNMALAKALEMARQAVANQAYQQSMSASGSPTVAQQNAQMAASSIQDPFALEPSAMAVFQYLSREIEYRDKIIDQINQRLEALGADPLDLSHPYPIAECESEGSSANGAGRLEN